jgi:phage terminase Nu1 subunit (DNA packaging protein)
MARVTTYGVNALARELGVTQQQVSQWKAAGMPFGRSGKIKMAAAVRWLREYERRARPTMSGGEAAMRRMIAEAELMELKLANARAEVVPAAEALAAAEDEATRVAGVLSQMPTEYAPLLASRLKCTLRQASAVLREVSDGVRARLAAPDNQAEEEAA